LPTNAPEKSVNLALTIQSTSNFVCFVSQWIDGETLDDYIKKNEITSSFIVDYVRQICNALSILKARDFRHDDLHLGNVMISPPPKGDLSQNLVVKIIDMGSLKSYNVPLGEGKKHDHDWFCEHLITLSNSMLSYSTNRRRPLTLIERSFRQKLISLIDSMLEEDKQRALFEPIILSCFGLR